jgi:hypothetical protein
MILNNVNTFLDEKLQHISVCSKGSIFNELVNISKDSIISGEPQTNLSFHNDYEPI